MANESVLDEIHEAVHAFALNGYEGDVVIFLPADRRDRLMNEANDLGADPNQWPLVVNTVIGKAHVYIARALGMTAPAIYPVAHV